MKKHNLQRSKRTRRIAARHGCQVDWIVEVPAAEGGATWPLNGCLKCGLVRLGRLPTISEAYPPEYFGNLEKKFLPFFESISHCRPALLKRAEDLALRLARSERRSPSVLDVGCGRGYLLKRLRRQGWKCAGIDIPGSPVPKKQNGMDCRTGDASSLPWSSGSFDLVVLNHVLEHVVDPWRACREAARVLRAGGILYLGVPNYASWQSRLFGAAWFPLEIPRHLFHFGPTTLLQVVSSVDLMPIAIATRSLIQGTFGFIQSALNRIDARRRNAFLALIKGQHKAPPYVLVCQTIIACFLMPLAVLETLLSSVFGHGPIIALVAIKRPTRTPGTKK